MPNCATCGQPIRTGYIVVDGQTYHLNHQPTPSTGKPFRETVPMDEPKSDETSLKERELRS